MIKQVFLASLTGLVITTVNLSAQCDCDCPQAPQGPVGPTGLEGPIGPAGNPGSQGVQGAEGLEGPCCSGGIGVGVSLYSNLDQTIAGFGNPGDTVLFEGLSYQTSLSFITTNAGSTGDIFFLQSGYYQINYTVQGMTTNLDLQGWSYGLYLDGVFVPGSSFAGFNDEDELMGSTGGTVTIFAAAGQALRLRNNQFNALRLSAIQPGIVSPLTSASLNIIQFKSL